MSGEINLLSSLLSLPDSNFDPTNIPQREIEWTDYIRNGKPLTVEAKREIWFSVLHRESYFELRQYLLSQAVSGLRNQGYLQPALRLAADSNDEKEIIAGEGYQILVLQSDVGRWYISLTLQEDIHSALPADANVVLRDSGGKIWARGRMTDGYIDAAWIGDESPIDRARSYQIEIYFD